MANGYLLHETDAYAVIATLESENEKTGNMIQLWILVRDENPASALRKGKNHIVCFDCKHQGTNGFKDRTCYVNLGQGPRAVWKAYSEGKYPYLPIERYPEVFTNRAVRFGAYGEPVLVPLPIVCAIVAIADGWTGYTHQWRKPEYSEYRAYIMASCDSMAEREHAKADGWRVFRARTEDSPVLSGEIMCPAAEEMGKRTQCVRCKLCSGANGVNDPRKDITIIVHGSGSKHFVSLDSIAMAV
jgi:hypothetical protein